MPLTQTGDHIIEIQSIHYRSHGQVFDGHWRFREQREL
jgi:hypothetical protein